MRSAPDGPARKVAATSSGATKMQDWTGRDAPPDTDAEPADTSQNWPPPFAGCGPTADALAGRVYRHVPRPSAVSAITATPVTVDKAARSASVNGGSGPQVASRC